MRSLAWRKPERLRQALFSAQRILVAGNAGAGKTTLCRLLSDVTRIEYTEMDGIYFGPSWTKLDSFESNARVLANSASWITEWQYPVARELLARRADLFIWLDLPRRTCVSRVVERSIRRRRLGAELWNGNVERPLHQMLSNRYHTVRWAFRHHGEIRDIVETHIRTARFDVVHIVSAAELSSFSACVRAVASDNTAL